MFSFSPSRAALIVGALLISSGIADAQDAPASKVAALLPPAREVNGLQVQITDAGFGLVRGDGSFYFSYNATSQDKNLSAEQVKKAVELNSLFAPDGTPLSNTAYIGERIYSTEVSPLWKSVRAEFEVRNLNLPDSATGREVSHHEFKVTKLPPVPDKEKELATVESDIEFTTARGSKLKLMKLTRENRGDESKLVAHWKFIAPADTPEVEPEIVNARATYLGANGERVRDNGGDVRNVPDFAPVGDDMAIVDEEYPDDERDILVQLAQVPADTQSVVYSFDFVESARKWRDIEAFQRVSIEVPVAALWNASPLAPQIPAVAPVKARNESFEAIWEMREPRYDGEPEPRLWVRDLAPAPDGEIWTLKGATLPEKDGQTRNLFGSTQGWHSVFHTDNSLASAPESSEAFPLYRPENLAESADLTVMAQRARTILKTHVLPLVPLPKRNDIIEFGPQEIFDGVWYLRRIIWIDDERLKDDFAFSGGAALLLTFDMAPGEYLAEDEIQLERAVFYDEKGTVDNTSSTFDEGDPAEAGHEKNRITMILSPPKAGSAKFGGNYQIFQRVWSGSTKTLVLPDVPLAAQFKETAKD